MKIGMVLDAPFPPDPRVENEAVTLINAGHDVSLFCLNFNGSLRFEEINKIKVYRYNFSKKLYNKLTPLAYSFPFYHLLLKNSIKHFIVSNNLDALHIHDMVIAQLVFDQMKSLQIPVILDLHENRPEIMKTYSHVISGIGKILINTDKWAKKQNDFISRANKVIVVTKEAKTELLKNSLKEETDITVVPNTVNTKLFLNYKIEQNIINKYRDNFVLLYLGSTGLRRGTDTAIKAIEILKNEIPEIKLVLVGRSTDDPYLVKLSKKLNVSFHVDFEGWQDVTLFPSYIKSSHICLSPLVKNIHHDTTYANKLFQYMAMGKPVLVSNCFAQANVVDDAKCGLVHNTSDEKDFSEKVLYLYKNETLAKELGKNGMEAVQKKYNWNVTGKNLIKLYNSFQD